MIIYIAITAFLFTLCLIYGLYRIICIESIEIRRRLSQIKSCNFSYTAQRAAELQTPFWDRIIRPALKWFSNIARKYTPIKKRGIIEKKLVLAGDVWGLNVNEFISLYYAFSIIIGAAICVVSFFIEAAVFVQFLCLIWGMLLGRVFIDLVLKAKIKRRQSEIIRELPDVLDLLTVSVEAGLGFDAAIQKVIQKIKGPISDEFYRTLQEIKMGKHRREALKDLASRTGVEDLNNFISAIIQADQLGVSIGNVLRTQSKQMRLVRKQRIEEKAMKAPIKMLLPMVFFIFPTIFLVLLGPAVIQMTESMK